jgi:hypothetical protein
LSILTILTGSLKLLYFFEKVNIREKNSLLAYTPHLFKRQQFQPLRLHSAASLHFKTPGDLGLAGASPKPPGFFAAT